MEEEKIELKDFIRAEKRYVLCLDTLGQDRIFDEEEQKFILRVAKTIVEITESVEKDILLKNRDLRLEIIQKDLRYKELVKSLK